MTDGGWCLSGFVRAQQLDEVGVYPDTRLARLKLAGSGYGLGLGWRSGVWRLEAGFLHDELPFSASADVADRTGAISDLTVPWTGGYLHVGYDLFRWSHLLVQADGQIEALGRARLPAAERYLPKDQYLASAGISVHATEINSVIPVAVVVTALVLVACMRENCLRGAHTSVPPGAGFDAPASEAPADDCKESRDKDCRR